MRTEVLGPVRLRDDHGVVLEVPERKVRALLAALTAAGGETMPADTLVERGWGEDLPANPQRVLQAKLSQLRSLLDQATGGGRELLVREPGGYRLAVAGSDAAELRCRVSRALDTSDLRERLERLGEPQELWRGRPYGEFAEELWASPEVAALEELRLQAVELQASALVGTGRPEAAYSVLHPLLDEHPMREPLVSAAMHACSLTQRQPEALRLYERLRTHLAEELGVDPGAEVHELFQQILRQDPALRPSAAVPVPEPAAVELPERSHHSLPRHSSSYIGREEETEGAVDLLGGHRLVTVLGLGGVGKTRLATAAAERALTQSAGGVGSAWFVDLTALTPEEGSDGIACSVAGVLQLSGPDGSGEELISRVASALEERRALLVLDNCEHLIEAVAGFTADMLRRAGDVRVLATSREPLSIPGEQRLPLEPLPVDASADGMPGAAVELFLARAYAVAPRLELGAEDLTLVAELCHRLDGLPLAVELAAGRMNMLSVQDLLGRITDRLDLLSRPGRGAPRRQQTLRGMLDWSWELLEESERALLRRMAVHPVSWTLDTVEAVCADPAGEDLVDSCWAPQGGDAGREPLLRRAEVLPVLARLVDRSLVATVRTGNGRDGVVRYRLLETVGAYAGESLEASGERGAVAARHIAYHRAMVECARDFLFGPHARDWVRWMRAEQSHLEHALREALRAESGADAVALTLSTFWYRWMTGRTDRLVAELVSVAACPGPRDAAHAQVAVLAATAYDEEEASPRHPLELLEANTVWPLALSERAPGTECVWEGEAWEERTRRWCERVLEALDGFADDQEGTLARMQVQWFAATPLMASAEHRRTGERLADEAIEYLLAAGDLPGAAFASTQRDWFLLDHWDAQPRGLPGEHDAEAILRAHGDAYGLTQVLSVSHLVAEREDDVARAERIAEEAAGLAEELGLTGEAAYWECILALNSLRVGQLSASAKQLTRARALAAEVGFGFATVLARAGEAALAAHKGDQASSFAILSELAPQDRKVAHRCVIRILGADSLPDLMALSRS